MAETPSSRDPLWYKDAIIYEVHVRAFADSDGDGIGDFKGLTSRLDYLQDLGVTAIWLLPFYPSPLRDDGYDIADYTAVNPIYGDMKDARTFIKEAHRRGLQVITELVCNHTSDQHPWFQRARRAPPGSPERDFYVWSDTPERYRETRIIFKDFESSNWTFDKVAGAYYWHRFYHHQPDLNFDNPAVHRALYHALDFWLKLGVDGLRLDAIPYLYERDGASNENLPETHVFLKQLRAYIDARYQGRMLLSEANQWPEDVVDYFGDGDECHMNFHFPLMPRLYMAIYQESRFPIVDILRQTPPIPESAQWALFLRNHDELTLEMVTDEERDYLWRVYAGDPRARINLGIRRRLAPLLQNNRRRIELMNGLLLSLPGTPVLYYGDEIGMGDNIYLGDRNGVRTPMQWSPDRNAGFSQANRQQLFLPVITDPEYHYEAVNVATQQQNPSSLLWWMKRIIALRKRYRAFGRGSITFLEPENRKMLAFVRRYESECILVVANLSRFVQAVELDLAEFRGMAPVELFGRVPFPTVADRPYVITLGPHEFFWFAIEPARAEAAPAPDELPALAAERAWDVALPGLADALLGYARARPWFQGGGRRVRGARALDGGPIPGAAARLALLRVEYAEGDPETYTAPLAWASGEQAERVRQQAPAAPVAALTVGGERGILFDAFYDPAVARALAEVALGRRRGAGLVAGQATGGRPGAPLGDELHVVFVERRNTTALIGERLALKLVRRVEPGPHPEVELGRALAPAVGVAPLLGWVEQRAAQGAPLTVATLHGFVRGEGDARERLLDALGVYLEQVAASDSRLPPAPALGAAADALPPEVAALLGGGLDLARQAGHRVAALHRALAGSDAPDMAPEPFTPFYLRSVYQAMRSQLAESLAALRRQAERLPETAQPAIGELLGREQELASALAALVARPMGGARARIHGDCRLEQLIVAGGEVALIDLEGDPTRPLGARRIKRSPLRDVAAMLRSFERAAFTALSDRSASGGVHRAEDQAVLRPAALAWTRWAAAAFLAAYLAHVDDAGLLPVTRAETEALLRCYLIDHAAGELLAELAARPERAGEVAEGMAGLG